MKLPTPELGYVPPPRMPGVHKLKAQYREFESELDACGDLDTLGALLRTSAPLLARFEAELPDWWSGEFCGDPERGLAGLIEYAKQRCATPERNDESL